MCFLKQKTKQECDRQILSFLDEGYNEYKAVLDAQAGIAFVSTPHLTESKQDGWSHLNFLLRSCPGFSKWQSQNELQTVANVCIKFDKAQIENPILSVYERRPTKIGEGWRHMKTMVSANIKFVSFAHIVSSLIKSSLKLVPKMKAWRLSMQIILGFLQ